MQSPSIIDRMSLSSLTPPAQSASDGTLAQLAPSPSSLPPAKLSVPVAPSLPPILVADDDADDRFIIRRLITRTGTSNPVITFDDGTEVVNYLGGLAASLGADRHHSPLLLFLDLRMTGLGGFEFLEWARGQKMALPLTIVVLSNSADSADMTRALQLGAHRYLVKYPSIQTFTTIIRSVYPFKLER